MGGGGGGARTRALRYFGLRETSPTRCDPKSILLKKQQKRKI